MINYSFVNKKSLQDLDISDELIQLKNPLNENLEVMRTSLLPGLLKTLKSNLSRGESFMKIFEEGKVFTKSIIMNRDFVYQKMFLCFFQDAGKMTFAILKIG